MIKVEKRTEDLPESLIPAYADFFPGRKTIPRKTNTTHEKRIAIIHAGQYTDKDEFNSRYKLEDIRTELNRIYRNKCAFCEEKVEQYHIEHYRPKDIYYWLAYSWDNLLLACPTCNQSKGTNFELNGTAVEFENVEQNIRNINFISSSYNAIEQPKMVNPEVTDPSGQIEFDKDGLIKSDNDRFKYTIEKCAIDRKYLNDERRKLLDIFQRDIRSALIDNSDPVDQQTEISVIVRKFVRDAKDHDLQFLAFRRHAIASGWLNELTKELN